MCGVSTQARRTTEFIIKVGLEIRLRGADGVFDQADFEAIMQIGEEAIEEAAPVAEKVERAVEGAKRLLTVGEEEYLGPEQQAKIVNIAVGHLRREERKKAAARGQLAAAQ